MLAISVNYFWENAQAWGAPGAPVPSEHREEMIDDICLGGRVVPVVVSGHGEFEAVDSESQTQLASIAQDYE